MSGFEIRDATAADAPGIRALFERVFRTPLSEAEWRWKFEQDPDGWYGVVAVLDGRIVGNYAGWAMRFVLDGEPRPLYSVGDVATDPSVRALGGRRGVYREMTDAFYARVGRDVGAVLLRLPQRARAPRERAHRRLAHAPADRPEGRAGGGFRPPPAGHRIRRVRRRGASTLSGRRAAAG